jgi:hypothetical protein
MTKQLIVGIDPSLTATGVAFYYPESGDYNTEVFGSDPAKTLRGRFARYDELVRCIEDAIEREVIGGEPGPCGPSLIVLEGYSMGSKGAAITGLCEFGGLLRESLLGWDKVVECSPSTLKRFVTGKGAGPGTDKVAMTAHIVSRWKMPPTLTEDEYEAYALARLGAVVANLERAANKEQEHAALQLRELLA